MMKTSLILFVGNLMFAQAASAIAAGVGMAEVTIQVRGHCELLKPQLENSVESLVRQAAQLDGDRDCDETFPGSQAKRVQRVVSQGIVCTENGDLFAEFSAVYLCY